MLAALLLLGSVGPTDDASRELNKGAALYRTCRAEIRLMDLPSLAVATERDLIDGSYCVGYLNGFTGTLNVPVCTQNAPMGTVVRAYVAYMDRYPQLLDRDRRLGVQRALQDTYPCPVKGMHPDATPNNAPHA